MLHLEPEPAEAAPGPAPGARLAGPAERHFLFHCHRIALDFGIQAALRALELNTPPGKNGA